MVLRGSLNEDSITVLVHGRPSSSEDNLSRATGYSLLDAGVSSLAVSLYSHSPDTRNQVDCKLETNANDLFLLNKALRERGKKMSVVAHSAGAMAALLSVKLGAEWDRSVLIDPSHGTLWANTLEPNLPANKRALIDGRDVLVDINGEGSIISVDAYMEKLTLGDTTDLIRGLHGVGIISAENSSLQDYCREYFDAAAGPDKGFMSVPKANHNFTEPREGIDTAASAATRWIAGLTFAA